MKKILSSIVLVILAFIGYSLNDLGNNPEIELVKPKTEDERSEDSSFDIMMQVLTHKRCVPESVATLEDGKTLVVDYREGREKRTERFHMIVIATQRKLSDSIKTVGEQLGLKLSQNVNASEGSSLEQTAKSGVAVAGGITTL